LPIAAPTSSRRSTYCLRAANRIPAWPVSALRFATHSFRAER
jgi:hypothetical protein